MPTAYRLPPFAGMTTNERFCLALSASLGIPTAGSRLEHLPEPVLVIERFDRARMAQGIARLHCIDGCQALGLPVSMKYEWPLGHGRDVSGIRDGASLTRIFAMLDAHASSPTRERIALLRWAILQVLIGNVDGHAKNLSFFVDMQGLRLAPAYDLVCGAMYEQKGVDDTLAMAIGDGYQIRKLGVFDWAQFSVNCKLPARLVAREMAALAKRCQEQLGATQARIREEGGDAHTLERVGEIIETQAAMVLAAAPAVSRSVREESGGG
jgi:serine/threonine-protein kinase HipA